MLVLSRHREESVVQVFDESTLLSMLEQVRSTGEPITTLVKVVDIRGDKVRLGCEAPKIIGVHRDEVYRAICREQNSTETGIVSSASEIKKTA